MSFFFLGKSKRDTEKEKKRARWCSRCGIKYDANHVDCPQCFRLECQNCHALHMWLYEYPKGVPKPLENGNCGNCGSVYNEPVTITKFVDGKLVKCLPFNSMVEWEAQWADRHYF
jgi:ribosomal protein S27AE